MGSLVVIGPVNIIHNTVHTDTKYGMMYAHNTFVNIQGPVAISNNFIHNYIALFESSDVLFSKEIKFISNTCEELVVIRHEPAYIKVMVNASIIFSQNDYYNYLISIELEKTNIHPFSYCAFQYVKNQQRLNVLLADYEIIFEHNFQAYQRLTCESAYYHFISTADGYPHLCSMGITLE